MMRPDEHFLFLPVATWTSLDPVVPYLVFAVDEETGMTKIGNGSTKWSLLTYTGGSTIAGKYVQSDRVPSNVEGLVFCTSVDKWTFRLIGCEQTVTAWSTNSVVYPKYTLLIEIDDSTSVPTGRLKIGDGITQFDVLPWINDTASLLDESLSYAIAMG
jgi:hypothetical protein